VLEILPAWGTGIALQDIIPLLGGACQVKGGEPDLVDVASTLGAENLLASVDLAQGVFFAVVCRK
jgi:hypothetical protein